MLKHKSLTTVGVSHDDANLLTEFIWLNKDINCKEYPWKKDLAKWGKTVSCLKKMMIEPYSLDKEQIAFYIYRCSPTEINSEEFAKMAIVAKKLFRKYDMLSLYNMYERRRQELKDVGLEKTIYKTSKTKSLTQFLEELENESRTEL
jgi:hypothetical protein